MTEQFFEEPILYSPYLYPSRHWELDPDGQLTNCFDDALKFFDGKSRVETLCFAVIIWPGYGSSDSRSDDRKWVI